MARERDSGINLLFTSAGRRVELLRAFRAAYRSLGLAGSIVAVDIDPLAPALRVADRAFMIPRIGSPGHTAALVEICRRESVVAVFPLIDPDIPALARHRQVIEETGARVAAVSAVAAAIAADKRLTQQFFQGLGLATPRTWLPGELDPMRASYPLFVKPRHGSASQYTFKVRDARELAFFTGYVPEPIVQEYLPGPEITSDVVCSLDGEVLGVVSRRRIEVRSGEVAKGVTVFDPGIAAACVEVARALPAVGPITVQCMLKEGVPHFTEINARLGGGLPLAIAAGANAPRWLLARIAGLPLEILPLGSYRIGLHLTRFDESFFLTEEEVSAVGSRGL